MKILSWIIGCVHAWFSCLKSTNEETISTNDHEDEVWDAIFKYYGIEEQEIKEEDLPDWSILK